jgi:hypothetical protein
MLLQYTTDSLYLIWERLAHCNNPIPQRLSRRAAQAAAGHAKENDTLCPCIGRGVDR